jgi:diketogulonate reductase-like aldo/keto reductase
VGYAWALRQARSSATALVPIMGAESAKQLNDSLGALELELSVEQLDRLDAVSDVTLGEPHDHNLFHTDLVAGDELEPARTPVA